MGADDDEFGAEGLDVLLREPRRIAVLDHQVDVLAGRAERAQERRAFVLQLPAPLRDRCVATGVHQPEHRDREAVQQREPCIGKQRAGAAQRVLARLAGLGDRVWVARRSEIAAAWTAGLAAC